MPREMVTNQNEIKSKRVTDALATGEYTKKAKVEDPVDVELKARFEFESAEFVDNGKNYRDHHEYDRSEKDQGLVLIFNQEKFDDGNLKQRTGSARDVNSVINTFAKLGFNIKRQNVQEDLGRQQLMEFISNIKADDCKDKNSLVVIFMSHGNTQNVLYTRDGQITVNELVRPLAALFKNKPKLFIIQACKSTEDEMEENEETQLTFPIYDLPTDVVIYYSTVEGKVAIRHVIRGTWVIEELCKNLLMYGRKEDVVSLLQRTTKCISILETKVDGEPYKQMPVTVSTLQKKFYLTANRYRRNIHCATKGIGDVCVALTTLLEQCSQH